jgi:hypothetical protein
MYITELLKHDKDLKIYQEKTFDQIGVMFPLEYLRNSLIRIFKDKKTNEMIGGFALVLNTKLRTLESIPHNFHNNAYNEENTLEVTGLWLDRKIKNGLLSTKFWLYFFKDVYAQKNKDYIIYAYDLKKPKLQKLYSKGSPNILYRGQTKKLKGMLSESIESIEVVRRDSIVYLPLKNIHFFAKKIISKRSTLRVRRYA